jgi:nucleoside-diphosphate-sugar epimerase
MKRFLIIGGNGYIGENLKRHLLAISDNMVYISDYHTGDFPIAQNLTNSHFEHFDAVIHLAEYGGIEACNANRKEAFKSNVISAFNVFRRARDTDVPVIFTSSQAANDPGSNEYAYQKWAIEQIAEDINQNYGEIIYILRLANVYGGYKYLEKKDTVITQFIKQYERGEIIVGPDLDGIQTKDFIHVDDVCEAIKRVINYALDVNTPYDLNQYEPIDVKKLGFKPKHNLKEYIKNTQWRKEAIKGILEDN